MCEWDWESCESGFDQNFLNLTKVKETKRRC